MTRNNNTRALTPAEEYTASRRAIRPNGAEALQARHISEYFGELCFNQEAQKRYLSQPIFERLQQVIRGEGKMDMEMADAIAAGMRAWAMDKGATHFTHWFQPLRGLTAQKHDTFFTLLPGGESIEVFSGKHLIQQEPDASSFPSGGLRSTFESRGYTIWDPSSHAFIVESGGTRTLCIPTVFISYTGESLDYKAPLLKSIDALREAATPVARLFYRDVERVFPTLGWEQEYFLIDEELARKRPDIVLCNRTLIGALPPRTQQLEDHYLTAIPERVLAFMSDLEYEAHRVGIPVRTRHNEVAPSQFECAVWFEEANLSIDHNQLLMELMEKVGKRHGLRVLLHEKPFAGINGSGKHTNWSLMSNTGVNLLAPAPTPRKNLCFLTFFVNVVKAVNDWEALLRASIASDGNDLRLGGNEAPPSIISVYIGEQMERVWDELINKIPDKKALTYEKEVALRLEIHRLIPAIFADYTDRNRTSPFAFTGNKFEFRAVGSSQHIAQAVTVLNCAVAHTLRRFYEEVRTLTKTQKVNKNAAVLEVLHNYAKEARRIIYNGDNYTKEWVTEAEKRRLSNLRTTPEALKVYISEPAIRLFSETKVLTPKENLARYRVRLERYIHHVEIEIRTLQQMCMRMLVPAAVRYLNQLNSVSAPAVKNLASSIDKTLAELFSQLETLDHLLEKALQEHHEEKKALIIAEQVRPQMEQVRKVADALELLIDVRELGYPTYTDMLFGSH